MSSERVGRRGYAAHRKRLGLPGGTRSAVDKAILDGRIEYDPEAGIDPEVADDQWKRRTVRPGSERLPANDEYLRARAVEKVYAAKREKLRYEKESGQVIDAAEAELTWSNACARVHDRLLAIPDRVGPELAGIRSSKKVRQRLIEEIRAALEELSQ